jgi:hypothetical protein
MTSARVSEATLGVRVVEVVTPFSARGSSALLAFRNARLGACVSSRRSIRFSVAFLVCAPFALWDDQFAYLNDPCAGLNDPFACRACLVVCPEIVFLGAFESQASSPIGERKSAGSGSP